MSRGRLTTATANKAITNGDASEVQLIGNAQVIRAAVTDDQGQAQPSLTFNGEFLHAFMNTEQVKSHKTCGVDARGKDRLYSRQYGLWQPGARHCCCADVFARKLVPGNTHWTWHLWNPWFWSREPPAAWARAMALYYARKAYRLALVARPRGYDQILPWCSWNKRQ